jgi:amino acid permease
MPKGLDDDADESDKLNRPLLGLNGDKPSAPKASFAATTINIITGGLGAGILSLPWAVAGASIVNAMILNAFVLGLNSWTIMLLIKAGDKYQKFDLGSLLEMLPGAMGRNAKTACNFAIWISMFLCLVSYMIVVEDSMISILPPGTLSRTAVGAIFSAILIPMCFLPMRLLSMSSSVAVTINVFLFCLLIYLFGEQDWKPAPDACFLGFTSGSFTFFR